ncbi:protein disulfide isomerase A [Rhizoclosmatium globosum]|uniref:Protein disulfide-isomerase n=1 Tax=Rhizoclosmatium globosum TaxID=329046 RepID=A0A1Y2C725_9FUNG|nr:protein disulfide-isomerase precursor [Rhizoclosmatium sp. JEL0117]ORY42746.1 protein disulfide isomerase A [Rhizoclosmatium globosum]|eukprot:ORY42746.1 protein disulfide isomerase A [Rhizoclosmatium globosum]
MKFTTLFATLFAVAAYAHDGHDHGDEAPAGPSDVVVLTDKTFSKWVKGEDLALVEFYAPWCGHCKALAPEYEIAATELKDQNIKLAKVDCTVETETCKEVGVSGYPTLKVVRKGAYSDFKGERKAPSIISTMKKQALPALSLVKAADIEDFKTKDKVVVIGYFSDKISKKFKAYEAVANALRDDFVFGYTNDKVEGVKTPAITLYKSFDEGSNKYTGKFTEEDLTSFIKVNSVPLIDEIGPENYQKYVQAGVPLAFTFVENDDQRKELTEVLTPVAKANKGKVAIVFIDAVKFGSHAKNLNLKEGEWPSFAINEPQKNLKFPFKGKKITTKAISKFVEQYVAGEIEPDLKSEAIPATNDAPVKVVVGKNFESIVLDKSKDVFLEVYAPWCGHCKKLAPIWDELAELLAEDKNIVIAKMDGTENDFPKNVNVQVQGFPTLKLWKAKTNEIVDYDGGDRTLEPLLAWLKKNATFGSKITASVASSADDEDDDEDGHDEL